MNKRFFHKRAAKKTTDPSVGGGSAASAPDFLTPEYKQTILANSYLTSKGFTIPKHVLHPNDIIALKRELSLKKIVQGPVIAAGEDEIVYAYRENEKKIYIPRYYAAARYGPCIAENSKISPGEDMSATFHGSLRDYQENIVNVFKTAATQQDAAVGGGGLISLPCGAGKCLAFGTEILMYDGTIREVQDIKVGDVIMGDDSTPRNVLTIARGRETMYKVNTKKGDGYTVNESHILSLKCSTSKTRYKKGDIVDISVKDYLELPDSYHGRAGPLYGYRVPIRFEEKTVEIDPYIVGYWLGDGSSYGSQITTQESSVIKYFIECFKTKHTSLSMRFGTNYHYNIFSCGKNKKNIFLNFLKSNNLLQNKHIPHNYKCNSKKVQLELLAGIIDSDGYYKDNCYEIVQKNEKLLDDIVFICRSLGFAAFKKKVLKTCTNAPNGPKTGTYYITKIYGKGLEEIPVKCARKKAHERKQIKDALNYRISLEKLPEDDYYGFEIDGNRRFVLGDFTVTHNTVIAIKIATEMRKKTLIIVHKEFLLNQWVERIRDFCGPQATIGRIQGDKLEVEGNDFVIGMLQTLYSRSYPEEVFRPFGLLIIDETHRICSEQFSRALFKFSPRYTLGISATIARKDGLDTILNMFVGDIVYHEERKGDDPVCVRAMEFVSGDSEFEKVEYDFRGNVQFSTMISKLCEHVPRAEFVVRVIVDLLRENPEQQIMVLAHNKNVLYYLHDAIRDREIATVGYYLGGMKERDLKETEDRQVVIATYAMAAEALDIKTLSTLVMVTPKKDITQSVGRILRMKHENPIVVDIVDTHDVFQNQWKVRRAFYKKCNYRIRYVKSTDYHGMCLDWDMDTTWKRVFEPGAPGAAAAEKEKIVPNKCLIDISRLSGKST